MRPLKEKERQLNRKERRRGVSAELGSGEEGAGFVGGVKIASILYSLKMGPSKEF